MKLGPLGVCGAKVRNLGPSECMLLVSFGDPAENSFFLMALCVILTRLACSGERIPSLCCTLCLGVFLPFGGVFSFFMWRTWQEKLYQFWCDFDCASLLICGNKMPTRCNRGFYCRSYCLLNMFQASLCPSSGAQEYYTVVAACGILCCGFFK